MVEVEYGGELEKRSFVFNEYGYMQTIKDDM